MPGPIFHGTKAWDHGNPGFSSAADWQPSNATMPGSHLHVERHSLQSRELMMRSLLKVVDGRRDQGVKHYIEPRKLQLIDQLTQGAPSMPLMHRDYPKTRTPAIASRRSRAGSALGGNAMPRVTSRARSRSSMGSGIRLTPLQGSNGAQTHPLPGKKSALMNTTVRPPEFYKKLTTVDPKFLAKIHKNMQEKVYMRFKNAREAFRRFDLDHSGAIDFREFKTVLRDLELIGHNDDEAQVEALFHVCDESGHGQISYQDFCKWIKAPDRHDNLMVRRETPYFGERGGMSFGQRSNWIRALGVMCE